MWSSAKLCNDSCKVLYKVKTKCIKIISLPQVLYIIVVQCNPHL